MARPAGVKEKRKRCTHEQFFLLTQWMTNNRDKLLIDRPPLATLAVELSARFGCAINSGVLRRAQEMIGLIWEPKTRTGNVTSSVPVLRNSIRRVIYRQRLLTEVVSEIIQELGMARPEALEKLLREDTGDDQQPRIIPINENVPRAGDRAGERAGERTGERTERKDQGF